MVASVALRGQVVSFPIPRLPFILIFALAVAGVSGCAGEVSPSVRPEDDAGGLEALVQPSAPRCELASLTLRAVDAEREQLAMRFATRGPCALPSGGEELAELASGRVLRVPLGPVTVSRELLEPVGLGGLVANLEVTRVGDEGVLLVHLSAGALARLVRLPTHWVVELSTETAHQRAVGPVIVLDPGHGGSEPGTAHDELVEKELVLEISRVCRDLLESRIQGARVYLTREDDRDVPLMDRAGLANALEADVFVSIHLNGAAGIRAGGVNVFVLDPRAENHAARLAAQESGMDVEDVGELQRLLASVHRDTQLEASLDLAAHVQSWTVQAGRRYLPTLRDRGLRRADFAVLVGAQMPAVLVEASFLTVPREAEALRTERYRRLLAEGIAEGVARFLAEEAPPEYEAPLAVAF